MAFYFVRINAVDFRDLEDKVSRPITVLQNVTFHRTLLDRFLVAFQEQVAKNAIYATSEVSFKCNYMFKRTCIQLFSYYNRKLGFSCHLGTYPSESWTPHNAGIRTRDVRFCSVRCMRGELYRL
jgi:hypothetical protein